MRFRLWTILWVFALLASAMATFGGAGIFVGATVIWFWIGIFAQNRMRLIEWLIVFSIIGALVALLLPAVQSAREASRRNHCMNNMKQIALALLNYESVHGSFPPAYIADADGKPMHSWRVLILPYLEHKKLYNLYDFNEPWDGLNNRKLWQHMPEVYRCPSVKLAVERGLVKYPTHTTNYFAVVGPQTMWPNSGTVKMSDVSGVASQTIMFMESVDSTCWMEPRDISFVEAVEQLTSDSSNGHLSVSDNFFMLRAYCYGRYATFADGHARFIGNHIPSDLAKLLLSTRGTDKPDLQNSFSVGGDTESYDVKTILKWGRVYSFSTFVFLSLLPLLKLIKRRREIAAI